jgi:hypothetical protein
MDGCIDGWLYGWGFSCFKGLLRAVTKEKDQEFK